MNKDDSNDVNGSGVLIQDRVAILDAGAQYGKLIDRAIRRLQVDTVVLPLQCNVADIMQLGVKAVVITGGPGSLSSENAMLCDPNILDIGVPVLGICYGMQLIAHLSGHVIQKLDRSSNGAQDIIRRSDDDPLFVGTDADQTVLVTHGDGVALPVKEPFEVLAVLRTDHNSVMAMGDRERGIYGVQFHPESQLTEHGQTIFKNFLFGISKCRTSPYSLTYMLNHCLDRFKNAFQKDQKALILLSGGVDSLLCAKMAINSLGKDRVICIHINNGFLRHNESDRVRTRLGMLLYGDISKVIVVDAANEFLEASNDSGQLLSQISEPESKRKLIGDTFVKVIEREIQEIGEYNTVWVQGTLRPDLIESASKIASDCAMCIKTHHNDSELIRRMREQNRILEPLKDFHKDEVREMSSMLGIPDDLIKRHPFPGPGLAIRLLCADPGLVNSHEYQTVRKSLDAFQSQQGSKKHMIDPTSIKSGNLSDLADFIDEYQIEMTVLPVKSVGVSGDCRTYEFPLAVHCPQSSTAYHTEKFWTALEKASCTLLKIVSGCNRVVYCFKSPEHLDVRQKCRLTADSLCALRTLDYTATICMGEHMDRVCQMPVILLPLSYPVDDAHLCKARHQYSVVLRPFITNDYMTGTAAIPYKHWQRYEDIEATIEALAKQVNCVMMDMTSKPPGTTEWE